MNQLSGFFFLLLLQNGVVHRDLKLENVLLDENLNIKVLLFFFLVSTTENRSLTLATGTTHVFWVSADC